ncbi:MAG: hypothetical protein EZS28_024223 [Streblomastix strix]|uniref:Uncharacterized protein n=1 Tax=Streblomastix strix TaxID=222440 RepID=A0A5J4VCL2_9EUKA|nr:MAG: hypothetical protein EZS28_024223 [Streblomastix strix]
MTKKSRAPDLAGTLQPREISVEISYWNREEKRIDEGGYSEDGGKNWRIDIQRKREWNWRENKKIYINLETVKERRFHKL